MPANSSMRRAIKRALGSLEGTPAYRLIQAATVSWDIRTAGWDEPEVDLPAFAIRPGETCVDVGANLGMWTYYLSRAVGPSGKVLAFEPVPSTFATLGLVCRLLRLHNVELHALGCGQRSGRLAFVTPLQESGVISSGLAHLAARRDPTEPPTTGPAPGSKEVWCDVVALDEFISASSPVTFLKCDIEGAELFAFRGAEALIAAHRPTVVCEITPNFLAGFGLRIDDVTGFFLDRGYGWFHYDRQQPASLSEVVTMDAYDWHNYTFIHPSRMERFAPLLG